MRASQDSASCSSSEAGSELPLPDALQEQLGLRSEALQQDLQPPAASSASEQDESEQGSDCDSSRSEHAGTPELDREQRKAHKKAVKEANRERRKTKLPKKVKKKATGKGKR